MAMLSRSIVPTRETIDLLEAVLVPNAQIYIRKGPKICFCVEPFAAIGL